ncbi:hypothetical protein IW262DRAFT_1293634 [Armillaria fumosa]|nr:hypothetical protein IW262DRAFT_1293634 [Armillaria fumosa]
MCSTVPEQKVIKEKNEDPAIGWIWGPILGVIGKKTSVEEMEKWQYEGFQCQWFIAEAKVNRWLEEVKIRTADFIWKELAKQQHRHAHKAWAMKQSVIYQQMWEDLALQFRSVADYEIMEVEGNGIMTLLEKLVFE